ncbi:preprotein translocase subunit SecE [Thioalkalivibrio sulfidiphilus]|uniref:Protein translocase subunit SecE n=1 Tax=Thioalkalivibrio sulfidiphilus (strain HL-EbGR7) TaxID=396588 RepID=B8GV71_THISH|nr:preprotein translocase subunit SecE [Thioalkalivibrio sulfidiphilus]ACL73417.1 preprotein translocase subunit SecE [Thioalkalivibrio sulfidiphilus HL-EbGr7]
MAKAEETQGSGFDTIKLAVAVGLLVVGVLGFYWYADESLLFRVLGLLAVALVAIGIVFTTALGQSLAGFLKESRTEVRKMVWPTRAEATQTTLIVIVVVILVGIFLWLLDMLLAWGVRMFIGTGG